MSSSSDTVDMGENAIALTRECTGMHIKSSQPNASARLPTQCNCESYRHVCVQTHHINNGYKLRVLMLVNTTCTPRAPPSCTLRVHFFITNVLAVLAASRAVYWWHGPNSTQDTTLSVPIESGAAAAMSAILKRVCIIRYVLADMATPMLF